MKKKLFATNIFTQQGGLGMSDLRTAAQNDPIGFAPKIESLVQAGKLSLSELGDVRELYRYLADIPVQVGMLDVAGAQRTMTTSAFPIMVGTTMIAAMSAAYEAVPTIGEQLVNEMEDSQRITIMASIHGMDKNVDEVKELDDFPEITASEETVHIGHRKNGRKLTVSAEMIRENRIPDIVQRVNALGEIAADYVEELTLARVTDHTGSAASPAAPYAYRPEGVGTALFSSTANTPGTRAPLGTRVINNQLVDETDLDAARTRAMSMRNSRGKHIAFRQSEVIILHPYALTGTLSKLLNSEYVPGVENEMSNWGPRGGWNIPPERRITSPKLDDLSASAWYFGTPKRQFTRKWKLRFEYVTLGMDTQAYLNSMVAFQARVAWDCEVGATDYVYWLQCLAATTAPADE